MSTIAHRPHRGLHVSRRDLVEIELVLLGLLAIVVLSWLLSLLPKPASAEYRPTELRAHVAQVHPGMVQGSVRQVIGAPSHVLPLMGRGSTTGVWLYDAASTNLQYQLTFHRGTLLSIAHTGL